MLDVWNSKLMLVNPRNRVFLPSHSYSGTQIEWYSRWITLSFIKFITTTLWLILMSASARWTMHKLLSTKLLVVGIWHKKRQDKDKPFAWKSGRFIIFISHTHRRVYSFVKFNYHQTRKQDLLWWTRSVFFVIRFSKLIVSENGEWNALARPNYGSLRH